jgi:long-chain acyl-CoA synthetase|tara:strand:- start:1487 stop:2965 length:1479 start_codon:yes stop_codon:yes gene_type:complete
MKTIYSILENSAALFPDKIALFYKDKKYAYREIKAKADVIKSFLIQNTKNQDIICLLMENCDYWLFSYFGILGAGCICNPIDLKISKENITKQIDFLNPKYFIVSKRFYDKAMRMGIDKKCNVLIIEEILSKKIDPTNRSLSNAEYSTIMFTSGTSGDQKAIKIENDIVYNSTNNIIEYLEIRYDDVYYAILPFSHSFGLGNVHVTFKQGGSVIISDNSINLKKNLNEISRYKATFFCATPFTLKLIVDNFMDRFIMAGESLRIICTNTGPMDVDITKKIINNLKKTLFYTYYGLTEASRSTFHCFNLYPDKLESVGKASPNVHIDLIDDNRKEVLKGGIGEICISGNNVVSGYYKNPELNKKVFRNKRIHTGDIGKFDDDGFLYVLGRIDDIVTVAGERVSLSEVDRVIQELDFIDDVGCIDAKIGSNTEIHANIVLKEGIKEDITEEVIEYCKKHLELFKVPKKIIFVNSIPRTGSGKLKRGEFRKNTAK